MMWVVIVLIAVAVFAALVLVLKLPRGGWELAGAALLLGISGYALQGHPGQAGAPKAPAENARAADAATISERQAMGNKFGTSQSWLILADALTRQGQYAAASDVLRSAVRKDPKNADLWVAMGNALVGHSDGLISPAAQLAFQRAADISPEHPGPPFFMGLALAQSGKLPEARALWMKLLARTPADAPYRDDLSARLARINQMLGTTGDAALPAAANAPPPAEASGKPPVGR
ncbi:tetratricopeptide repeat protein [Novosphingobium sp.]|uniref:tetratricopeptide repeat protein n=1 Tax=Novosphingobium sp. TaxID=1874826 RepID=UPI0025ECC4B0|nr:tetratricopeptide repeat protein [Novosphingobium sp.]